MTFTDIAVLVLVILGMVVVTGLAIIPALLEREAERPTAPVTPLRPHRKRPEVLHGSTRRAA